VKGMKHKMQAILSHPAAGPLGKAVVLVHGGPVRRVSTNFSPTVTWLTANGYSVLQPNFRGSSGFGEKWRQAGYGEWGRGMQHDVRASGKWLVKKGFGRKETMCVMGGSYGGYAALMSAIMDDDLFSCAVSLNGVSSLPHLITYLDQKRFNMLTVPRIKGRSSARALQRRSPLYRADLVRMPVLLLHSTRDANVPFQHTELMVRALRKNNKPHEFVIIKGAEHVLKRTAERRVYLQRSLDFINEHTTKAGKKARLYGQTAP
jgi:dipeptidyl aminopeptidase/acylaminoacyl peptidase